MSSEKHRIDEGVTAVGFRVRGRVQGVSYRWFGRKAAEELSLNGWIRNRADGDVEGEAFGPAPDIERFLERLREGPPAARVEDLEWRRVSGGSTPGFAIRY